MSRELPYFRWYPKDAESDSKYTSLSLPELGLYHRCMNHSWLNDGIPEDVEEISRELRITLADTNRYWPRVSKCFVRSEDDGRQRNPRQEIERNHAISKSEKASVAVKNRKDRATSECTDVEPTINQTDTDDQLRAFGSGSIYTSNNNKLPEKKISLKQESDEWFKREFWVIWPRKENKEKAIEAARKVSPSDRPAVLTGLRKQIGTICAMERPIHAATWLNHKRWEDEFVPSLFAVNGSNGASKQVFPERTTREVPRPVRPTKEEMEG